MANIDSPFGFRPVKHISGSKWNGQTNLYCAITPATVLGVGDPVALTGTANADGIPEVARAADDSLIVGVITSLVPDRENQSKVRVETTDTVLLNVCDSPDVIYEVQVDDNGIVLTDFGNIADIVFGNASATTGHSICELDGADIGTGDDLRILRKKQIQDNTITTTASEGAYAVVEVLFTKHLYGSRSTTAV